MTADTLVARANAALSRGELVDAADLFERAAQAHVDAACPELATNGYRLAAMIALIVGAPERGATLALRALATAAEPRARFAALVTLAEAHRHAGRAVDAVEHLSEAIDLAESGGAAVASPVEHAALLRRRAGVHHALGQSGDAVLALRRAEELLAAAGEHAQAAVTDLELAGLLDDPAAGPEALAAARGHAIEAASEAALAQVDAAEATAALEGGDVPRARALYGSARDRALEVVDPATYIAAVNGLAMACELGGDRVAAYGSLASGWVTISDLLGDGVGAEAFRPPLQRLRERWGAADFARIKAAHDAARRTDPDVS